MAVLLIPFIFCLLLMGMNAACLSRLDRVLKELDALRRGFMAGDAPPIISSGGARYGPAPAGPTKERQSGTGKALRHLPLRQSRAARRRTYAVASGGPILPPADFLFAPPLEPDSVPLDQPAPPECPSGASLNALNAQGAQPDDAAAATAAAAEAFPAEKDGARLSAASAPPAPSLFSSFSAWLDTLRLSIVRFIREGNYWVAGGVVLILLGCAFLATYFSGIITLGPRIALCTLAGTAMVCAGVMLRRRASVYALILQGGGIGIVYLSLFAAVKLPEPALLPPLAALLLMALLTVPSVALALIQNAQSLAFFGFLGAFAAPILLASDSGNFVGLFSYYTLLDVALLVICRFRIWNGLNSLGAFCTFSVLGAWIARSYAPSHFWQAEPFVLGFVIIFLLITLTIAHKRDIRLAGFRDFCHNPPETLLALGTPMSGMVFQALLVRHMPYGLAFSALGFGMFFIAWPAWIWRRWGASLRGLAQVYLAGGFLLTNLTLPLAFSGRLSAALWAAEGALVFFFACRAASRPLKIAGLFLQAVALPLCLKDSFFSGQVLLLPESFILAASALFSAFMEKRSIREGEESVFSFDLSPILLYAGFCWLFAGLAAESLRHAATDRGAFFLLCASASTLVLCLIGRYARFPELFRSVWVTAPFAVAYTLYALAQDEMLLRATHHLNAQFFEFLHLRAQFFDGPGAAAWPLFAVCMGVYFVCGKRHCAPAPRLWLLLLIPLNLALVLTSSCRSLTWSLGLSPAWGSLAGILPSLLYIMGSILALERRRKKGCGILPDAVPPEQNAVQEPRRAGWNSAETSLGVSDRMTLCVRAPLCLFAFLGLWTLFGLFAKGDPAPLPLYIPLLNPLELEQAVCLILFLLWRVKAEGAGWPAPFLKTARVYAGVTLLVFIWLHSVIFRSVYFYTQLHFSPAAGLELVLAIARERAFQALLTGLWGICGLGSVIWSHRRKLRPFWVAGAGLIALDTAKLFLLDLAGKDTIYSIISFFVVGAVFLCIGFLAPLPPAAQSVRAAAGENAAGETAAKENIHE